MKISISPLFGGAILLGILILVFALTRGCSQGKLKDEAYAKAIEANKVLEGRLKANEINFNTSLEYANGVISLRDNQLQATRNDLVASNSRIDALLKKHKPVQVDTDDSVTMVPNTFVEECSECFAELEYHKGKSSRFIKETDSLHVAHLAKEVIQEKRIKQLEGEKEDVSQTLTDCLTAARKQADKLEPRRTMYLNMGAIGGKKDVLMGIGAGLMYQDKRKRGFGFTWYGTSQGSIVTANLSFPLSFKRK